MVDTQYVAATPWYKHWALLVALGLLILLGGYALVFRAIDTGSPGEYFLTGVCAFVGFKLFGKGVKRGFGKR